MNETADSLRKRLKAVNLYLEENDEEYQENSSPFHFFFPFLLSLMLVDVDREKGDNDDGGEQNGEPEKNGEVDDSDIMEIDGGDEKKEKKVRKRRKTAGEEETLEALAESIAKAKEEAAKCVYPWALSLLIWQEISFGRSPTRRIDGGRSKRTEKATNLQSASLPLLYPPLPFILSLFWSLFPFLSHFAQGYGFGSSEEERREAHGSEGV